MEFKVEFEWYCINPSRPDLGRREKINLIFYFHTSLLCLKKFYYNFVKCTRREGLTRSEVATLSL